MFLDSIDCIVTCQEPKFVYSEVCIFRHVDTITLKQHSTIDTV